MLKLSELHARHRRLTRCLPLRGFKTRGTRLWFILPPQVMKALKWPAGQRLRFKVSRTGLVMTPLRQASVRRKVLPRKRAAVDQLRQDLACQACLKKLRRSVQTKGLVKRQRPRTKSMQSPNPTHSEPALSLPMDINQIKGLTPGDFAQVAQRWKFSPEAKACAPD